MKKEMIRRVANRKLEARMLAPVTNFFKGDSKRIDEYVDSLAKSLDGHLPEDIVFKAELHQTDDLEIKLISSNIPVINIVKEDKVRLNSSPSNYDIHFKEITTDMGVEELHLDRDILFGDLTLDGEYIHREELVLYGDKSYSEELLSLIKVATKSQYDKVIEEFREEVDNLHTQIKKGSWDYGRTPIPGLVIPSSKHFEQGRLLSTDKGFLSFKNNHQVKSIEFFHDGEGFKTHFKQPSLKGEYAIFDQKAVSYTFNGLLSPLSCIRVLYFGFKDQNYGRKRS